MMEMLSFLFRDFIFVEQLSALYHYLSISASMLVFILQLKCTLRF